MEGSAVGSVLVGCLTVFNGIYLEQCVIQWDLSNTHGAQYGYLHDGIIQFINGLQVTRIIDRGTQLREYPANILVKYLIFTKESSPDGRKFQQCSG